MRIGQHPACGRTRWFSGSDLPGPLRQRHNQSHAHVPAATHADPAIGSILAIAPALEYYTNLACSRPPQQEQGDLVRVTELEYIKAQAATTVMLATPCLHGIHVRFADARFPTAGLDLPRGSEAVLTRTRMPLDAPA